jgi:YggT family protein
MIVRRFQTVRCQQVRPFRRQAYPCQGKLTRTGLALVPLPPSRYIFRRARDRARCLQAGKIMNRLVIDILWFISYLLTIYVWILIASAVMSWLIAFNVINPYNQVVRTIGEFLYRITEPVLRPIRNILPNLGGIDISPVIVILIIFFIQSVVIPNIARALIAA